jgi:hypothetical protein
MDDGTFMLPTHIELKKTFYHKVGHLQGKKMEEIDVIK